MRYSQPQFGPGSTPRPISILLMTIAGTSVLIAILNSLYFGNPGLEAIFGLSLAGIKNSSYWQLLTYPFLLESEGQGLSSSFIMTLAFNLYILWILCTVIFDHIGSWRTGVFMLLCTLGAASAGLGGIYLIQYDLLLSGQMPLVLGLLTLWAVLNPEAILLLFFIFPVKVKWLALGLLAVVCFNSITQIPLVFFYVAAPIIAYFFGISMLKNPWDRIKDHVNHLFGKKASASEKVIHVDFS